ncbi:putative fungal specific transcription factor domain-containing protein [Phaeomoniella chlamydospora]|uniref:Putative fungal specific transcription factor domain-containing protein n=1 Tax=Phaeomoniella chlamydospora TaxID=158046 RepID=A0A0G2GPV4_PHACM|nr:putative fungal specific transcription factor domain-containing protein [Phaeomoniella chlamydospora]
MHPGQAAQASATGRNDVPVSRLAQKPCLNCRRRKVKCDRGNPCLECLRFAKTCNYDDPNPGLEQSPPSLVQQEELLSRLDKLEKSLEQRADASLSQTLIPLTLRAPSGASLDHESISDRDNQRIESGSLIIERGQSLYLAAGHWAKLFEETEESKILLNSDLGTPHQTGPSALFGSDLSAISHVPQHPTAVQTKVLCDYFFGKIEPFIRILHEPTFRREHQQFQLGRHESPLEFKAILFVIYALTILLCPSEVIERHFGEPINDLLGKYQVDIELALSRIHFLRSRKLLTFQALLYWITFLYESGDFETASSMVGLATQIAHRLGLHKDPALSYNTPFVGEMRKRAWNHLYYFNLKTYEIDGLDHQLSADDASANIFPSNTDDALWENWLHTQLSRPPQSREGFSGMAFVLLRRQLLTLMAILLRQIADLPKERAIGLLDEARERFKAQYFRHFDISEPMQRLVEAYSSIAFDRITLAVDIGHVKYGRTQTDEAKNE